MPAIESARALLKNAKNIAVLTGAGISAESGIPTFRGASGLWKQFRPEELATPEAFARDPQTVWEWYHWRRKLIAGAKPNAGHLALARLEQGIPEFTLVTQNVDGLHQAAGSKAVLELHGSIWTVRCTQCPHEWMDRGTAEGRQLLYCRCGALARPGVVWFGEVLPPDIWREAEEAVKSCDLLLVIGTSAVVYPAAGLVPLARSSGARVMEINIERSPIANIIDLQLTGQAGHLLPELVEE
ncbi:MAG: NAD-dependent deacylase [Acidobacteriaceae bacterium]|nr:NAD-dependent deacylase [Acidobacteriaceae bacterium]